MTDMTIVDAHCHIASFKFIPRSFVAGSAANVVELLVAKDIQADRSRVLDLFEQKMQDPLCDALVQEMNEAGIGKCILLIADFTLALKDCELSIEESFCAHRDVLARHSGRFEVFGGVDPRWGKDGLALFERSLTEYGFRGFKVYPPCGFSPSDRALFPFYEICAHHGAPVVVHIGPTSPVLSFTGTNPFLLDDAARQFPGVDFVLAHGAVNFTEECAMMCRFRPNVYLDVSAYQGTLGYDPEVGCLRDIFARGISHKILFGTDWPVFRLQGTQRNFVDAVTAKDGPLSGVAAGDRELVLHGNIERLLHKFCAGQNAVRSAAAI
jgi:predicted TIM-barrel fold metal-dependent hydrolase